MQDREASVRRWVVGSAASPVPRSFVFGLLLAGTGLAIAVAARMNVEVAGPALADPRVSVLATTYPTTDGVAEGAAGTANWALAARVGELETSLRVVEAALRVSEIARAAPADRFLTAALLLQSSIATARPWQREYETMMSLAPEGLVARPFVEVLASHAARGVATEGELRARFDALSPHLALRAPQGGGFLEMTQIAARSGLATIGLALPPPPSETEITLGRVAEHLRHGNLSAAVADAEALDPGLLPLLSGWLAQARSRLAIEQAVQETLLRALARDVEAIKLRSAI